MNPRRELRPGTRVLVTGASGFLGRHLVDLLKSRELEVIEASRSTGFRLLEDELTLDGVDHVFHLAAETGVADAWQDAASFHLINTHGTVRVLEQCRRIGCSLTYLGAYIYGVPDRLPIAESDPVRANNPYAFSKWLGEESCRWYAQTFNMAITAIRLFNVYGRGQSNRFLIPRIVEQALDPSVESITLLDLEPRRDYVHVSDAVTAMLASLPDAGFHVFNVGSGRSWSVGEVVERIQRIAGTCKPVVDRAQKRPNEIPDTIADIRRIRAWCGWHPTVSLDQGIEELVMDLRK